MMYLPSYVMVGWYFDKRRALALGIARCGSGIGTFVMAPLSKALINLYSWKGATWVMAGICLQGAVCGALLRPISVKTSKTTSKTTLGTSDTTNKNLAPEMNDDSIQCKEINNTISEVILRISPEMISQNQNPKATGLHQAVITDDARNVLPQEVKGNAYHPHICLSNTEIDKYHANDNTGCSTRMKSCSDKLGLTLFKHPVLGFYALSCFMYMVGKYEIL